MADAAAVVHLGENSPEHVAYKLFLEVARAESMDTYFGPHQGQKPDRKWILDTYAECIRAVTNRSQSRGTK